MLNLQEIKLGISQLDHNLMPFLFELFIFPYEFSHQKKAKKVQWLPLVPLVPNLNRKFRQDLKTVRVIGAGAAGVVRLVMNKKTGGDGKLMEIVMEKLRVQFCWKERNIQLI